MTDSDKTEFTNSEASQIRDILTQLYLSSSSEKKKLRRRLRNKLGFHISYFDASNNGFTSIKFDALIKAGKINIIEGGIIEDKRKHEYSRLKVNLDNQKIVELNEEVLSIACKTRKLEPVARLISDSLEKLYNIRPNYILEYKPQWLTDKPVCSVMEKYEGILTKIYSSLTENKYNLIEQFNLLLKSKSQSFDIWFCSPFNFAVEFDESQHFNQFRALSLNYYPKTHSGFDVSYYKTLCNKFIKPSISGFCKLKAPSAMFPAFLEGLSQDNRIRQRAYRDVIKDFSPVALGFNPTIRIPYNITSKKIKDFNNSDLENISFI